MDLGFIVVNRSWNDRMVINGMETLETPTYPYLTLGWNDRMVINGMETKSRTLHSLVRLSWNDRMVINGMETTNSQRKLQK